MKLKRFALLISGLAVLGSGGLFAMEEAARPAEKESAAAVLQSIKSLPSPFAALVRIFYGRARFSDDLDYIAGSYEKIQKAIAINRGRDEAAAARAQLMLDRFYVKALERLQVEPD